MGKLLKKQFERASSFMKTGARELERALFEYEFEEGSKEQVLETLKPFQNEDGGFGNGLEPDFRCKESSALATAIGLETLARIGIEHTEEMVQRAVRYLLRTFDENRMGWKIVPKEVVSAPRAIWWNDSENWPWGNPTAEIIGLLHHYRPLVSEDFLRELTEHAIDYANHLNTYDHHEMLSFLRMWEKIPLTYNRLVYWPLRDMAEACVAVDQEKWRDYAVTPLQVVKTPDSPFYKMYAGLIQKNLDHLVATQQTEGYWEPTWSWGQFEKEWERAKQEWRGRITLDHLLVLRAFDYIES